LDLIVDTFTPEIETPVNECAVELVLIGVLDDNGPFANSMLSPVAASVSEKQMIGNPQAELTSEQQT